MSMTGREHEQMRDTATRLGDRFTELAAQRGRPGRQEYTADRTELRWQRFELLGMLETVNNERAALGKPSVDLAAIRLADGQACGHVDYARKFPWYCAEIVYGVFPLVKDPAPSAPGGAGEKE